MNEQQQLAAEGLALSGPVVFVMSAAAGLSLLAGFFLFQRHVGGAPLLVYEPRRRAPWGPLVLCIPLLFVLSGLTQAFVEQGTGTETKETVEQSDSEDEELLDEEPAADVISAEQFVLGALIFSALQLTFVAMALMWMFWDPDIDPCDFGWPESMEQFALDVVRGVTACFAALLPVLLLNIVLFHLVQTEKQHPMIEQFQNGGTPMMFFAGAFAAIISAPIFEEFAFRVLLQGWLEKLEDQSLNFQATERPAEVEVEIHEWAGDQVEDPSLVEPEYAVAVLDSPERPSRGWWHVLPHGWLPILISSIFFGFAHFGHGVAPIPLILLGIVLGYLYQRTHRIVPCIAAHMVFNSYSMLLLWLST